MEVIASRLGSVERIEVFPERNLVHGKKALGSLSWEPGGEFRFWTRAKYIEIAKENRFYENYHRSSIEGAFAPDELSRFQTVRRVMPMGRTATYAFNIGRSVLGVAGAVAFFAYLMGNELNLAQTACEIFEEDKRDIREKMTALKEAKIKLLLVNAAIFELH